MLRRRRDKPGSNPDSRGAGAPSFLRAAADSAWLAKDRLGSGVRGRFETPKDPYGPRRRFRAIGLPSGARRLFDAAKWPFERVSFAFQQGLVWPLEDRAERAGRPTRALGLAAIVLLAVAAGVGGLIWAAPDRPERPAVTAVATETSQPLAAADNSAPEKPAGPTLHGAAPNFTPAPTGRADDVEAAKPRAAAPSGSAADAGVSADATASSEPPASASTSKADTKDAEAAKDSTAPGPPAGPEAIAVARDFADAFVLYETGDSDGAVRKAFGESAAPRLSRALMRRPPRLPANVTVPRAKVVNVVAAPSHGDVYPVSVSLLRVGVTSELRLEMEELKGSGWQVTNVLG
jgi:hypothetical protein